MTVEQNSALPLASELYPFTQNGNKILLCEAAEVWAFVTAASRTYPGWYVPYSGGSRRSQVWLIFCFWHPYLVAPAITAGEMTVEGCGRGSFVNVGSPDPLSPRKVCVT